MKKLFYMMAFAPLVLFAGLNINKINNTLLSIKSAETLTYYNNKKTIDFKNKLRFTTLSKANIILFPNQKIKNKMVIVDSYKALGMNKNSIGAIYLKKGRTQIIFIKERLKRNGLSLPASFKNNLLSECQVNPMCFLDLKRK